MAKKSLSIISAFIVFVFSVGIFQTNASAVYYEGSFPYSQTGLTGGTFIECDSSIGSIVLVLPQQYKSDTFTFTTDGNLYNSSNSSVTVALFRNGVQYQARFSSFNTLEYRESTQVGYNYTPVVTYDIIDTNVKFVTDSERVNENYYFTEKEIAFLSVLIAILFFVFLGWFLWHRH